MVMIFVGGHVSGGHCNPAVGAGFGVLGKLAWGTLATYWWAQLVAGAVVGRLLRHLAPRE